LTFYVVSYLDLARGGLATDNFRQKITLDISGPQTLDPIYRMPIIPPFEDTSGNGDFTYYIPEFAGEVRSSVHAVHSSTNCIILRLDGNKYWKDYGGKDQTSKGMLCKPHGWALIVGVMKFT